VPAKPLMINPSSDGVPESVTWYTWPPTYDVTICPFWCSAIVYGDVPLWKAVVCGDCGESVQLVYPPGSAAAPRRSTSATEARSAGVRSIVRDGRKLRRARARAGASSQHAVKHTAAR